MMQDHVELNDTKIIRLIVDDRYRLLRHAGIVLGILAMIFFSNEVLEYHGRYRYLRLFSVSGCLILMCYINMNILVARFFFRGRYILYLVLLLLVVIACRIILSGLLDTFSTPEQRVVRMTEHKLGLYEGTLILIAVVMVTTTMKLFQRWMRDNERMVELRNITLTMELNELRNQINPHFLFNMLNGIKALVRIDPDRATTVIMKLSEFLRYQLYENNEEKTLLRSEIKFLSNFLSLEKLRRDNLSVDISSDTGPGILNLVALPPNLFTTFLENAVKHSVDISGAASYIRVKIEIIGDKLHFSCLNSRDPEYKPSDNRSSGLGLANIKRRLELLYGNNYYLETTSTLKEYKVNLTIPL